MELSVNNFRNVLSKELIKKAEQNMVRECDEIITGHFQAYVDENNQTFDVAVQLNPAGDVLATNCDCTAKATFCRHRTALLLHISREKKVDAKIKLKKTKKEDPILSLLDTANPNKLKLWLKDVLLTNKELALVFTHQFTKQQTDYTPEIVTKMTHDAVKAVLKNKKKPDISEIKKIVELWTEVHKPVLMQYYRQVENGSAFLNFNALVDACQATEYRISTNSSRLVKYQENIVQSVAEAIHLLKKEEAWNQALGYFMLHITCDGHRLHHLYPTVLFKLHELSGEERKRRLTEKLIKLYQSFDPGIYYLADNFTRVLLQITVTDGLFGQYYLSFKPIRFDIQYNKLLISNLMEHHHFAIAEKYCLDQIEANQQEFYNYAYLIYLQEIYELRQDEQQLTWVLKGLFPFTFNFDIYLRIMSATQDAEEKKKWRTRMLISARQLSNSDWAAQEFLFLLADREENYKKMLEYINKYTSYEHILPYADKLALTGKGVFLAKLTALENYFSVDNTPEKEAELMVLFKGLLAICLKRYSIEELTAAVLNTKRKYHYPPNKFVTYLENYLEQAK